MHRFVFLKHITKWAKWFIDNKSLITASLCEISRGFKESLELISLILTILNSFNEFRNNKR